MRRRWMPPWYWRLRDSRIWGCEAQHDIPLEWGEPCRPIPCPPVQEYEIDAVVSRRIPELTDLYTPFVETWAREQARGT